MRCLDIGCGKKEGRYKHDGYEMVYLDIDSKVEPDVAADARKLPFENEEFDAVHSSHLLEHFSRVESLEILKEWVRVLKQGGKVRLVVPNIITIMERLRDDSLNEVDFWVVLGKQGNEFDYHKNLFTPNIMRSLCERAELKNVMLSMIAPIHILVEAEK
uniref:Putative methyltransferase n=1 Tax=viral metagenome TaxID=1070528 RepID=A0A6H2A0M2_9ZZZZ